VRGHQVSPRSGYRHGSRPVSPNPDSSAGRLPNRRHPMTMRARPWVALVVVAVILAAVYLAGA